MKQRFEGSCDQRDDRADHGYGAAPALLFVRVSTGTEADPDEPGSGRSCTEKGDPAQQDRPRRGLLTADRCGARSSTGTDAKAEGAIQGMAIVGRLHRPADGVGSGRETGHFCRKVAIVVRVDDYRERFERVAVFVEDV